MRLSRIFFWPIYPLVVATLPVLHFYLGNFRLLNPGDPLRIWFFYLLLTGVLIAGGRLLWKDTHRSALALTPLLLVMFKGSHIGDVWSAALLVLSLVLGAVLRRTSFNAMRIALPLNLAALVFVALPTARIIHAEWKENSPRPTAFFESSIHLENFPEDPPPDIYFLIVDGLGQPEFLEGEYPLSRGDLAEELTDRGFRVLNRSQCSYPQTALSVASTLNLGFVQELLDIPDQENMNRRVLGDIIGDNRVARALRQVGYKVATFPSGYPITRLRQPDNRMEPAVNPSFLEFYVLDDGMLPLVQRLMGRGPADFSYSMRRHRLNFIFDELPRARSGLDDSQPIFVFAHILAPHPPFVFDDSGEPRNSVTKFGYADGSHWFGINESDRDSYRALYSAQFTHVMNRLAQAVDGILANSPRPPVIVIQGDHGPGSGVVWEDPLYTDHQERSGIYNAWYLPPDLDIPLAEDECSVNTFTLLFNGIFDSQLEPRQCRHWFAKMSRPYRFYPANRHIPD
jgi:hypothetical protein